MKFKNKAQQVEFQLKALYIKHFNGQCCIILWIQFLNYLQKVI